MNAQNPAADAIQEQRHRALDKAGRLGEDLHKPAPPSNKIDDDPTRGANMPAHTPPAAARKLAEKGQKLSAKAKHSEAIEAFQKALELDPGYFEAANDLALEFESAGDVDKAIATLKELTHSTPDYVVGFTNLAAMLCNRREYRDAELAARRAVALHPYSFKANLVLGIALVGQNRWSEEAKRDLEYASLKHPTAKELLEKWPAH